MLLYQMLLLATTAALDLWHATWRVSCIQYFHRILGCSTKTPNDSPHPLQCEKVVMVLFTLETILAVVMSHAYSGGVSPTVEISFFRCNAQCLSFLQLLQKVKWLAPTAVMQIMLVKAVMVGSCREFDFD